MSQIPQPQLIRPEDDKRRGGGTADPMELLEALPSVPNTANLHLSYEERENERDFTGAAHKFWASINSNCVASYDKGTSAGKHSAYDTHVMEHVWRSLTQLKATVLNNLLREQGKSTSQIKFLLDVLNTIDDNLEYVIEAGDIRENIKEQTAYIHGFMNAVVTSKNLKGIDDK